MNYTLECLEKFEELSPEVKDVFSGDKAFKLTNNLEDQYNIDLAFLLILLAINELNISDVAEYLKKKYELAPEKANLIVKELNKNILNPASKVISKKTEEINIERADIYDLIYSVFSENLFLLF